MPEKWTGRLRGHMFNENISVRELAQAAGWSFAYVSAILHGKRIRPGSREILEAAYEKILAERKAKKKAPARSSLQLRGREAEHTHRAGGAAQNVMEEREAGDEKAPSRAGEGAEVH